ncbi:hypothetical protein GRAN_3784 [Granulicella sibirica]|uniref:Uncharacterized protein n=1 Tax=Granulicella sibirica TaxID=2479048 RepID=A0A4Q0SXG4_9BACT|nr:hypothetical protein GRAN_3784 [Granulicella sibirica]
MPDSRFCFVNLLSDCIALCASFFTLERVIAATLRASHNCTAHRSLLKSLSTTG